MGVGDLVLDVADSGGELFVAPSLLLCLKSGFLLSG